MTWLGWTLVALALLAIVLAVVGCYVTREDMSQRFRSDEGWRR